MREFMKRITLLVFLFSLGLAINSCDLEPADDYEPVEYISI
jgi:hypothetical protein